MSVAWRISEEPWFKKTDVLSDLKLRAGYGVTGSQAGVSNYGYLASYNTSVYSFGYAGKEQAALVSATLANPNIHWEEVAQTNVGFDASLFGQRINLSLDTYIKDTRDMLVKASIPITSGFEDTSTTYTNAGKVRNTGFEFTLNTVNLRGPLGWETSVTYTYNKNKIKDLNSAVPYYINQINNSYVTMLANHFPINVFYGYVTDGVFQNAHEVEQHASQPGAEPGDIRFKDLDNNGVINDNDRTVLGNPNPTHMFSMNNLLTWKGFELSIYLQGVAGNKIFNANKIDLTGMSAAYNQLTDVLGRWHGEGTSNRFPRLTTNAALSEHVNDTWVENGDYLRMQNITLGYDFKHIWRNSPLQRMRLYVTVQNLFTITGYKGMDPEVGFGGADRYGQNATSWVTGIDMGSYPSARTWMIGANLTF